MKVGSYVVRKKYGKDIIFQVTKVEGNVCYLKGKFIRLVADAFIDDLEETNDIRDDLNYFPDLQRVDGMLKGKVLHLDGDDNYLNMGVEVYKKMNIPYVAYHIREELMKDRILELLEKHKPDILVVTGHDNFQSKLSMSNLDAYTNSRSFVEVVKLARTYQPDKDSLIIFAGACQSYYEMLIASGANFASSPKRLNIHALDPAYIASQVSQCSIREFIDVENFIGNTYSKEEGIGGIDTRGVARNIYSRR